MRAQTPSPNSVPLGTTTAARAGRLGGSRLALELAHDELEEQQRRFRGLPVFGEIALDALLLLAAEGRIGEDHVHAIFLADFGELEAQSVAGVDLRRVQAVQQQVHLAEQIRQGLWLAADDGLVLQTLAVGDRLHLLFKMVVRLDQKAARAAGRVEDGFAKARIGDFHHEAHDGARRVELAGVAGRVAHFPEHGFVESAEGVDLVARREVDAVDLVDHVAQQIAALHAVIDALETRWRSRRGGRRRWSLRASADRRTGPGLSCRPARTASS